MKIGVFGGSFNPVHNGHVLIANDAVTQLGLDKLFVVPNFSHPKKVDENTYNTKERLDMLNLAFKGEKIEISKVEIDREGYSYSYDTLEEISSNYQTSTIFFITGSDILLNIENWYMGKEILKKYEIAYFNRDNLDISDTVSYLIKEYNSKIRLLKGSIPSISSKLIRDKVVNSESISELVPKEVEEYIIKNGLYRD